MIGQLPPKPTGSGPNASFMQWVWENLRTQYLGQVAGSSVNRTTRGNYQISQGGTDSKPGTKVTQYILKSASAADYFVARTISADNAIGATDIYIAKPYNLRRTPFHGKTVSISVESTSNEITVNTATRTILYTYLSSTFRLATDTTSLPSVTRYQSIVPRFVPATLVAGPPITTTTQGPTIIYAVECASLGITATGGSSVGLLAINDTWTWAQVQSV